MERNKIVMGCDDAALEFKNTLADFLRKKGYEIEDVGITSRDDPTVYPHIAEKAAELILAEPGKRGILICGTGIGMAMSANKVPGIRAAQVHDSFSAERAALSNDANVITMGARVIGIELGKKLAMEWLPLQFQAGPSSCKVEAIMEIEKKHCGKGKSASARAGAAAGKATGGKATGGKAK